MTRRCPSYAELFLHRAGGAPGAELRGDAARADAPESVAEHLAAGCRACERRLALLEELRAALGAGPLPEVPPHLLRAALAIPEQARASRARGALGRLRELFARPLLDTASLEFAPALRDGGPIDRHLLFGAGPFEVDLALVEGGALVGQVLCDAPDEAALRAAVCVLIGEGDAREAPLRSNGDFHFEDVGPGRYALLVEGAELRIVVPDVDFSPPP